MQLDLFSAIFLLPLRWICANSLKKSQNLPILTITMNFRKSKKKIICWTSQRKELQINVEFIFYVIEG